MELVAGGTARQKYLKERHTDPEEAEVLRLAVVIAEGLAAAHAVGLTHMDIKPGNILLDNDGVGKLIDFGAAPYAKTGKAGGVVGTPYYIAPEVVTTGAGDFRSDMYSFGATIFHILAGEPPFDAASPRQAILARLKRPAPSLRDMRVVHPMTADIVARLLQRQPEDRYVGYTDLIEDLRAALRAVETGEPIAPIVEPVDDPLAMVADASTSLSGASAAPTGATPTSRAYATRTRRPGKRSQLFVYGVLAAVLGLATWLAFSIGGSGDRPRDRATSAPLNPPPEPSEPMVPPDKPTAPTATPTVARPTPATPIDNGLVGRWTFDNLARGELGTPAATPVGGCTPVKGPHGTPRDPNPAVRVDGTGYINIEGVGAFLASDAFSYGAWLRPESGHGVAPLSRMNAALQHRGYDIFLANFQVAAHVINAWPDSAIKVTTHARLKPNEWQHVLVTYDGSGRAAGLLIYVDGVHAPTATDADTLSGPIDSETPFVIGARSNGFARNSYYVGAIDHVVLYNRTLTADEARQLASPDALR